MIHTDQNAAVIRPLHPDDASALYDLFRQPSPHSCDYFEADRDLSWYQSFTDAPDGDHYRLVAVRDNHLLGLGVLERPSNARLAHLGKVRLLMPAQDLISEAAFELLSALIDLADSWLNLRRLEAESPYGLSALHTVLRRAGFVDEGLMSKVIGPGPEFEDVTALARLRGFDENDHKRPPMLLPARAAARRAASGLSVRAVEVDDIEDLYELFRAPRNCRTTLQLPSLELWLTRRRVLEPPEGLVRLVAERAGRVIGMISLNQRRQHCRSHVGGIGMMVHPDHWGTGIGTRLMEEVLDLADRQLGLTRVELQVHTDNPAGIQLYKKFGFVKEGTKHFHTYGAGGWADTYFMARVIE